MMGRMQIGLALPQYDYSVAGQTPLRWSTVAAYAQEAERVGFGSLWLADHVTLSIEKYGGVPGEHKGVEPVTGLSALSGITTTPLLGALVLCAQLRPVTVLAKLLAGVDLLSGGRLVVGPGPGDRTVRLRDVNWLLPAPAVPLRCRVKLRAREAPHG